MRIKSLILAALCMATVGVYAQSNYPFNGLDMNMGNLSRLSDAKTRSISLRTSRARRARAACRSGQGQGSAQCGQRSSCGQGPGQGLEGKPLHHRETGRDNHDCGNRGSGSHPADLDDTDRELALLHPENVLGRREGAFRRMSGG